MRDKKHPFVTAARNGSLVQRTELRPESFIPYVRHLDERTVVLESGALLRMWRVEGLAFETVDAHVLQNYHEALNEVWRSLDDPRVAIWQHTIRSREPAPVWRPAATPFGEALDDGYFSRLTGSVLRHNELLVSLVILPISASTNPGTGSLPAASMAARSGLALHAAATPSARIALRREMRVSNIAFRYPPISRSHSNQNAIDHCL